MASTSLEDRVTRLEKQIAAMQGSTAVDPQAWRTTIGAFGPEDEGMHRIFDEAIKYREKDRAKTRKPVRKSRKAKS